MSFQSLRTRYRARAMVERLQKNEAAIVRDAVGVGLATGAYGLSFGALSTAAGLSVVQTCALSLLMFTGASQFAIVGLIGAGASPIAGAATAALLGSRNTLYGLALAPMLGLRKGRTGRKLIAAHLIIDESTAMALGQSSQPSARLAFWATGTAVFALWNLSSLAGALGAQALSNPKVLGLDAAAPAAFLALLAPRMRSTQTWAVALEGAAIAVAAAPFVAAGVPVLLSALAAAFVGSVMSSRRGRFGDLGDNR